MKPFRTWILIADGARARVVVNDGPGSGIRELEGGEFGQPDPPSREMGSDRPGRTFNSTGSVRHALAPRADPHRRSETQFAATLADYLDQAIRREAFDRLIIVAPPVCLGDLRAGLSEAVKGKVTAELNKDLTKVPNQDLVKHLDEVIAF